MSKISDKIINFLDQFDKRTDLHSDNENDIVISPESLHAQQKFNRPRHPEYPCMENKKMPNDK
jgi:hypothetical protein